MKAIFCHDLPLYRDTNGIYCSTTLTNSMFSRYFKVATELIVATRVYSINQTYEEAHQEALTLENLTVFRTPNMMTAKGMLVERRKFKQELKKTIQMVDLVFLRGGESANVAYEICKEMKKPYLIECGGCAWESFWHYSLVGKLIAPRMEFFEIQCVKNASYVVYVTEKYLQKRYPTNGKCTHASNVYLEKTDQSVLENRLRKIRTYNNKKVFTLGTTAAIDVKCKGQQYVIRAISNLRKRGYFIRYELVGGGQCSYLQSIAEKYGVEDSVLFLGQKTHDDVLKWLDSIDIYVQPSKQEGLPRALIEAMSRGCPAIGSITAGIPELLQDNVLFEKGQIKQIEDILMRILKKEKGFLLEDLACENFEKAKEYEYEKISKRREEIFTEYANFVKSSGGKLE